MAVKVAEIGISEIISFQGAATAIGGAGGSSIACATLAAFPDFDGQEVVITGGALFGQTRTINGITTGGVVTPDVNFGVQIPQGTQFMILSQRVPVGLILAWLQDTVDGVYFDSVNGVAGVAAPIGFPGMPSNNLANALTMMTARKLSKLYLVGNAGAITFTTGFNFEVVGNPGYDITINAGAVVVFDGPLVCKSLTNTTGTVTVNGDCQVIGAISNTSGTINVFGNCKTADNDVSSTTGPINIAGNCEIRDLATGTGAIAIAGNLVCRTISDPSTGPITVRGNCLVKNNLSNTSTAIIAISGDCYVAGFMDNASTGSILIAGDLTLAGALTNDAVGLGGIVAITGIARIHGTITNTGTLTYRGIQLEVPVNFVRLTGVVSAPFTLGETVVGDTSGAIGIVFAQAAGYIDVIHTIGGPFVAGDTVTGSVSLSTCGTPVALTDCYGDVLLLDVANTHYTVDKITLKSSDPGADVVRVKLWELINAVLVEIARFDITTLTFTNYFSLNDMFGVDHLSGDELQVTVEQVGAAAGPYAVTGSFCYRSV